MAEYALSGYLRKHKVPDGTILLVLEFGPQVKGALYRCRGGRSERVFAGSLENETPNPVPENLEEQEDDRKTYFAYEQSGRKLDRAAGRLDGREILCSEAARLFEENGGQAFRRYIKAVHDEADAACSGGEEFGIVRTGSRAGAYLAEHALRKEFLMMPYFEDPMFDEIGGIEAVLAEEVHFSPGNVPAGAFSAGGSGIFLLDPGSGNVLTAGRRAKNLPTGVSFLSAGERQAVFVGRDGGVIILPRSSEAEGEKAARAFVGTDAVYLVTEKGRVRVMGDSLFKREIERWSDIVMIADGGTHAAGLRKDGTVVYAAESWDEEGFRETGTWRNIRKIAAARDVICGLTEDGKVRVAGIKARDPRKTAELLGGIVDIGADSQYVVGITAEGAVKLAGRTSGNADMGRSRAGTVTDAAAVACGRSSIAILHTDGTVSAFGNIRMMEPGERVKPA